MLGCTLNCVYLHFVPVKKVSLSATGLLVLYNILFKGIFLPMGRINKFLVIWPLLFNAVVKCCFYAESSLLSASKPFVVLFVLFSFYYRNRSACPFIGS